MKKEDYQKIIEELLQYASPEAFDYGKNTCKGCNGYTSDNSRITAGSTEFPHYENCHWLWIKKAIDAVAKEK